MRVMKMMTAKEKKAMKALALMSGCRFWKSFASKSPPMMNMKAVSGESEEGERRGGGRGER